jgi:hypothetical protein
VARPRSLQRLDRLLVGLLSIFLYLRNNSVIALARRALLHGDAVALVGQLMRECVAVTRNRSELERWVIGKIPNAGNRIHCCVAGRNAELPTAPPKTGGLPIDSANLHVASDDDGVREIRSDVSKLVRIPASSRE